MTETHTPDDPAKLDAAEATSAKPVKGMRSVLTLSLITVIILFAIILAMFM